MPKAAELVDEHAGRAHTSSQGAPAGVPKSSRGRYSGVIPSTLRPGAYNPPLSLGVRVTSRAGLLSIACARWSRRYGHPEGPRAEKSSGTAGVTGRGGAPELADVDR